MNYELLEQYLTSVCRRFSNMAEAGRDLEGYDRFQQMVAVTTETGLISPGEFEYLMDRTHPAGKYPDYNQYRNYDQQYGSMLAFPLEEMMYITDWRLPVSRQLRLRLDNLGYKVSIYRQRLESAQGWQHPAFETQ